MYSADERKAVANQVKALFDNIDEFLGMENALDILFEEISDADAKAKAPVEGTLLAKAVYSYEKKTIESLKLFAELCMSREELRSSSVIARRYMSMKGQG